MWECVGGVDIRTNKERTQQRPYNTIRNALTESNGTSLQSATTNCRLQREQNFNTNSILSMPLTTQGKATHLSHPTATRDLKAIMIIVHSDTVKLGYVNM